MNERLDTMEVFETSCLTGGHIHRTVRNTVYMSNVVHGAGTRRTIQSQSATVTILWGSVLEKSGAIGAQTETTITGE
ncbi:hypothetical protein DPEC_G00086280 [Dallia pectoralis]|uniref:Uncharacterized protein n=1 Tax=Dallia pectoralis TaxID=75939 RepID=A0ACC2H0E1_DALPE|nr:hypothetical protein DPEC_G00086280 [Dallia pectoralis]